MQQTAHFRDLYKLTTPESLSIAMLSLTRLLSPLAFHYLAKQDRAIGDIEHDTP
jgi:hypothetical protein